MRNEGSNEVVNHKVTEENEPMIFERHELESIVDSNDGSDKNDSDYEYNDVVEDTIRTSPSIDLSEQESDYETRQKRPKRKKPNNYHRLHKFLGRKKDDIWIYFDMNKKDAMPGSRSKATCKACKVAVSAEARRLRKHYEKCPKRKYSNSPTLPGFSRCTGSNTESVSQMSESAPVVGTLTEPKAESTILNFVNRTSTHTKETLDILLAKYIFSANLSFHSVENEEFKNFISQMRPSYKLPSAKTIGGPLLNKVYNEIRQEVESELNGKEIVLQQDGWSSSQNHPIVAHSATCGRKNYFLQAITTGTNTKSADYCQKLFEQELIRVENEFQAKVIGCVTDNCNAMKLMRANLVTKYQDLYVYGCNSHLLNLVGQSFTPTQLKGRVVKVQSYFRNTHFASASLLEKRGRRPVMPGDTRWNSQIDCFE